MVASWVLARAARRGNFWSPQDFLWFSGCKNPTQVSAAFPKALGLWADLGGRCSPVPSLQNSWRSIPRAGSRRRSSFGKELA